MTQPLRRAHLWIWVALAIVLPVFLAAGLLARRPTTPVNPGLAGERLR